MSLSNEDKSKLDDLFHQTIVPAIVEDLSENVNVFHALMYLENKMSKEIAKLVSKKK